jgi:hypothetical protein
MSTCVSSPDRMQVTTEEQQEEKLYNGSRLQQFANQSAPTVKRITRSGGTHFRREDRKESLVLHPAPKTYAPTLCTEMKGGKRVQYHEKPYDPWAPVYFTGDEKMKTGTTKVWYVKDNTVPDRLKHIAETVETVYTPEMRQRGLAPQPVFTLDTYPKKVDPAGPAKVLPSWSVAEVTPVEKATDATTVVKQVDMGLRVTKVLEGNPKMAGLTFYPVDKPVTTLLKGKQDKSWDGLNARVYWLSGNLSAMAGTEHEKGDWVQRAKAAIAFESFKHDGTLRCIICRKNPLDGFLTCADCDVENGFSGTMPSANDFEILRDTTTGVVRTGKGQASFTDGGFECSETESIDFAQNRMDHGFQDDGQHEKFLENKSWKGQVAGADEPIPFEEEKFCWILAVKFTGFTVQGSRAWFRAQRAAAQIAGRYILGYSSAKVSAMVPNTTPESVAKFTGRIAEDGYWESIACKPAPKDLAAALQLGLLRALYPQHLTTGELVESFSETKARRGRRKRLLDPVMLNKERTARRAEKARQRSKDMEGKAKTAKNS